MLNKKIKQAKWGDKVLQNISADLQKELPGLRGFSFRKPENNGKTIKNKLPTSKTYNA